MLSRAEITKASGKKPSDTFPLRWAPKYVKAGGVQARECAELMSGQKGW